MRKLIDRLLIGLIAKGLKWIVGIKPGRKK